MKKQTKPKQMKRGQGTTEYVILMVFLAIVLIPAVDGFRRGLKTMISGGNRASSATGREALSKRLSRKASHSPSQKSKKMPKWKSKYVPMRTIWDVTYDPEKKGSENQYEPATSQ